MREPEAPAAALDHDVFCLKCAYNLRGLSGDPLRCPECGHLNPLGMAEIPAAMIAARLRELETAPVMAVAAVLFGIPILATAIAMLWATSFGAADMACCVFPALPAIAAPVVWVVNVRKFKRSCAEKPGWTNVLTLYHVVGLGTAGPLLAAPLILTPFWGVRPPTIVLVLGTLVLLAVAAFLVFGLRRVYQSMRARMDDLQREVAVQMLREESWRRTKRR